VEGELGDPRIGLVSVTNVGWLKIRVQRGCLSRSMEMTKEADRSIED